MFSIHCSCPYSAKQSTLTALMEPLADSGLLTLIPNTCVSKIIIGDNGEATGVSATVSSDDGASSRPLTVRAKVVVVAAGSLHTPAVLLRSGFRNRLIGKFLTLHPVLACAGITPTETTGLASGVCMGVVVRNESLPSPGYGVAIETPPLFLNMMALSVPWQSGFSLKAQLLSWKHMVAFIGISRDYSKESNRVSIDANGDFEVHYDLTAQDEVNVINGLIQQLRIMRNVKGIQVLSVSHDSLPPLVDLSDIEFERYVQKIRHQGVQRGKMNVFSAHQMGSCRMAVTPDRGPVSPEGSLFECSNVFVADGSLLPTSLGVNPMITIEAMAHMVSKNIISKINATRA